VLWLSTVFLSALLAQELVITRPLWYGQQPQSPPLPEDGFALEFTLRPARNAGAPTVALLAAARLPGRYAGMYGGRINGAIQIVAIELDTGRVYHAPAERPGAVPLALVMDPDRRPRRGEAAVEDIETHFNADLCAHLSLPPNQATYAVFLWLDELTSPVRLAQLPGPQGQVAPPPKAADARIVLTLAAPTTQPGRIRIQGAAGPAVLTVLALDYRSRALKWRSVPLPKRALQSGESALDLALNGLLAAPGSPQRTFVVANAGQALSNVLVVNHR
jgi:hypothetical protein